MLSQHKTRPLTKRQRQVVVFIAEEMNKNGRPPTLREIGVHLNVGSTNAVRSLLNALERKGYVRRRPFLSRGIELLKTLPGMIFGNVVNIPIVGRVAAGQPLLAEENIEGMIAIDRSFFRASDGFALRVKGQSMIDAGIHDGDIVFARPNLPLEQGAVVVALIGEEATVKHYYPEKDHIRLEPANPVFGPLIIEKDTPGFQIAGKVVALYRSF